MISGTKIGGWRKLAGASWKAPSDPQFFGSIDVDAAAMLEFIDRARHHDGVQVTMTHLMGRAVAHGLEEVPAMRQRLAHGRAYLRPSTDIFYIVTADGGRELTGVKITDVDLKSATQIATELRERCQAIDEGRDLDLGRTKSMIAALPRWLLRAAIRFTAWLTSDLNINLPKLGLPRQAFGSAMITSVGMWGVTNAFSPLTSYYRVPVLVLVGAVEPRPVAHAGSVVVRPMMTITATFDHRYVDGLQASQFAGAIRQYCSHPEKFEPTA
jgi:pyruvate/2-oxoglutarate dehydrogenase complex dihydrolipoamide acyltransferase (E2) component